MTPAEHLLAGNRLLSDASFVRSPEDLRPVSRNGEEMSLAAHAELVGRARTHLVAAGVWPAALRAVLPLVDEWQRRGVVTPDDAKEMLKALGEVTG